MGFGDAPGAFISVLSTQHFPCMTYSSIFNVVFNRHLQPGHPKWSKFQPCTLFLIFGRKMGCFMVFGVCFGSFRWATQKKTPSGSKLPMWRLRWKVEGEKDQSFRLLDGVWWCWWSIIEHTTYTLPKFNILLMVQTSGYITTWDVSNPANNGIFYHINWLAGFLPSTVAPESHGWLGRRSFPFPQYFQGQTNCQTFEGFFDQGSHASHPGCHQGH